MKIIIIKWKAGELVTYIHICQLGGGNGVFEVKKRHQGHPVFVFNNPAVIHLERSVLVELFFELRSFRAGTGGGGGGRTGVGEGGTGVGFFLVLGSAEVLHLGVQGGLLPLGEFGKKAFECLVRLSGGVGSAGLGVDAILGGHSLLEVDVDGVCGYG
jgi:hypothetical protein